MRKYGSVCAVERPLALEMSSARCAHARQPIAQHGNIMRTHTRGGTHPWGGTPSLSLVGSGDDERPRPVNRFNLNAKAPTLQKAPPQLL